MEITTSDSGDSLRPRVTLGGPTSFIHIRNLHTRPLACAFRNTTSCFTLKCEPARSDESTVRKVSRECCTDAVGPPRNETGHAVTDAWITRLLDADSARGILTLIVPPHGTRTVHVEVLEGAPSVVEEEIFFYNRRRLTESKRVLIAPRSGGVLDVVHSTKQLDGLEARIAEFLGRFSSFWEAIARVAGSSTEGDVLHSAATLSNIFRILKNFVTLDRTGELVFSGGTSETCEGEGGGDCDVDLKDDELRSSAMEAALRFGEILFDLHALSDSLSMLDGAQRRRGLQLALFLYASSFSFPAFTAFLEEEIRFPRFMRYLVRQLRFYLSYFPHRGADDVALRRLHQSLERSMR